MVLCTPPLYIVVSYNSYYTLEIKTCRCYNVAIKNKTKHQRRGGEKIVGVWKMIFTPGTYFQLGINSHTIKKYVSMGNKFPLCKNFRVPCQLHKVYVIPSIGTVAVRL